MDPKKPAYKNSIPVEQPPSFSNIRPYVVSQPGSGYPYTHNQPPSLNDVGPREPSQTSASTGHQMSQVQAGMSLTGVINVALSDSSLVIMANNIALTPIREEQQHVAPTLSTPFPQLQINSPCADLLHVTKHDTDSRREDYLEICVPLYEASMTGDWRTAESIIKKHPEVVRCSITENNETALHVAASAKNTHFVKNLVKHMKKEDMELQNKNSNTALSLAAAAGAVTIAKIIVEKNITLLTIPNSQKMMPLYMAALFGKMEMVKYLYGQSHKLQDDGWTSETR
ncbi:putative ankyrin repeat-containing domain, PGG domain protein, partial [Tanacetum coccineum]